MARAKKKATPMCALNHSDCIQYRDGKCMLLTDMEVVNKQHHCGFYKTKEDLKKYE